MTVQCCKCKRLRRGGVWRPAQAKGLGEVTSTYCPTCFAESMEEIRRERALLDRLFAPC